MFVILLMAAAPEVRGQLSEPVVLSKCWAYGLPELAGTRLGSDGSMVFLGYVGAAVESVSLDGKKVWRTDLGGDITSNLLSVNGGVFLVTATTADDSKKQPESVLRSLSSSTGITAWSLKLNGGTNHFIGSYDASIIVVSDGGTIQSIDSKSGTVTWKREIAEGFVAKPVFNGTKLSVAGKGKQIFRVSMATGEMDSMRRAEFGVTALGETWLGAQVAGDERGNIVSFDNDTGKAAWRFKTGGAISAVSQIGSNLLVTSNDNFVYLLAGRNGDVAWKKRLSGRIEHIATVGNRYVVAAATDERTVTVTDGLTGKVAGQIAFAEGEKLVHDPIPVGDVVFLLTDNSLYAYSMTGCSRVENGGAKPHASPPPPF